MLLCDDLTGLGLLRGGRTGLTLLLLPDLPGLLPIDLRDEPSG